MGLFPAQLDGRARAFALLTAVHFAAAVLAVQAVVGLLGLQELPVVLPPVVGLLWGQAILVGQFLVLGTTSRSLRFVVAASWYAVVIYLARPALPGPDFVASCVVLAMPVVLSALLAANRRLRGFRIVRYDRQLDSDAEALRFSLRHLFLLTLVAAVALACLRLARDAVGGTPDAFIFGIFPATVVFALLPLLSLWATLEGKQPTSRSVAVVLFGLASVVGPLFIGQVDTKRYWMLVCPVVVPSAVVVGSLLIVRAIGYRYVVDDARTLTWPLRQ